MSFKALSSVIVETISISDLETVERNYVQLSDEIKMLKLQIANKDKTELDFFRYLKPLREERSEEVKRIIKKKFRAAVKKFCLMNKLKGSQLPNAMLAL